MLIAASIITSTIRTPTLCFQCQSFGVAQTRNGSDEVDRRRR
jgi:hypothetical protein